MMRFNLRPILLATFALVLASCGDEKKPPRPAPDRLPAPVSKPPKKSSETLAEARARFVTKLTREESEEYPTPAPPAEFDLIKYKTPPGDLDAYVSVDPGDGKKHPAIIWLVGGFGNSISESAWEPGPADNDQSASTFWKGGIITMYPSLRGGNESPGFKEGLYGEVDDVIAAANHLGTLDYVNPERIYLGGHSVGGTLALLVAESTGQFRAVFALGPVASTSDYGSDNVPYDVGDAHETRLRAPVDWLSSITSPTFAFEGTDGNIDSLRTLSRPGINPLFQTLAIPGHDHFGIIRPVSELLVKKILTDTETGSEGIKMTPVEVIGAVRKSGS